MDSDRKLTGGVIGGYYNNGEKKLAVKYNGVVETTGTKLVPQTNTWTNNENNRGAIYLVNSTGTNHEDRLRVVLKQADESYIQKWLQLID